MLLVGFFCVAAQAFVFWLFGPHEPRQRDLSGVSGNAERGAYIAKISGCTGCHTDRENGGGFLAGGAAIKTAMGVFFPPNITSDKNAGVGLWDLNSFANALTLGLAPDGTQYYPTFPYSSFANLSDQDIADLWAAFQTTTPSTTPSISHKPIFPITDRRLLVPWRRLDVAMNKFVPQPERSPEWNRGAYLALGSGRCMSCHVNGDYVARVKQWAIAQAPDGVALSKAGPDLSAESLTNRNWTKSKLVAALKSGTKPSGENFTRAMAAAVENTTSNMSESDLSALATYLLGQGE